MENEQEGLVARRDLVASILEALDRSIVIRERLLALGPPGVIGASFVAADIQFAKLALVARDVTRTQAALDVLRQHKE